MSPKTGDPYHGELSIEEKHGITGGSQAPEAEALLKGQPHEAGNPHDNVSAPNSRRSLAVGDSESLGQEVGGSDTARLQQRLETFYGGGLKYCIEWQQYRALFDAQALALRTVRDERDKERDNLAQALDHCTEELLPSLRADVARLEQELTELHNVCQHVEHALMRSRADVARLTGERDWQRAQADTWIHRAEHAEQQIRALRASIEQLIRQWDSDHQKQMDTSERLADAGEDKRATAAFNRAAVFGSCSEALIQVLAAIKEP